MTLSGTRLLGHAKNLAVVAHGMQKDQTGQAYSSHPRRVAATVRGDAFARTNWQQRNWESEAVAWLHDVLEDTSITKDQLVEFGFPDSVVDAVWALTHLDGEPNELYWERVKRNELARMVKLHDIRDNLQERRLRKLPEDVQVRLRAKYARALEVLS